MTQYEYLRAEKAIHRMTVGEVNELGAQGWQFVGEGVWWMREKPSETSYRGGIDISHFDDEHGFREYREAVVFPNVKTWEDTPWPASYRVTNDSTDTTR